MRKKSMFSIVLLMVFATSCGKIEQIENNQLYKNIEKIEISNIADDRVIKNDVLIDIEKGIDLNEDVGVKLEEEEIIIKRFELVFKKYDNHSELMRSIQYEQFVDYISEIFNKYKKINTEEAEIKNNYLFNRLIPKIVINSYLAKGNNNMEESEMIIQSIKRKDLNTKEDKNFITEKFKIYFEEESFNPFIKELNIKGLSDEEKVEMLLDNKKGIFYKVLSNRYNWNKTGIGYKSPNMEAEFMKYLNLKMDTVFGIIGLNEENVKNIVFKRYNITSLEQLGNSIFKDFNYMVKKYDLEGKIPLKRGYRSDEKKDIFIDRETVDSYINFLAGGNNKEFIVDLEKMRIKMYLLSYFGKDRLDLNKIQGLWASSTRSKFISPEFGNGVQNLFRLSRYTPGEKVKINLDEYQKF